MKTLDFSFATKLTFDNYVHNHSFALRCLPIESAAQHILNCEMNISPFVPTKNTVDSFGNNVTSGYISKEHRFLDFEINGRAEIDVTKPKTDFMPCYLYQSEYTKPDKNLTAFYTEISAKCSAENSFERAAFFSDILSDSIRYEKGVTDTKTTAVKAFELKKGVCQDFSHIMLSLLRMDKIPCRYIAGLAACDGETHSWIEVWDGEKWCGFDPANNCPVNEDYLVLAQGRDFGDCSIDRGVMFGAYTKQLQLITSSLKTAY
ncbi:MAG: transglutaminase family protein [Alistipes sp.]|nr:transglutaminase family protein [Alistipes sp.]